jgi:hypothetical protein
MSLFVSGIFHLDVNIFSEFFQDRTSFWGGVQFAFLIRITVE